MEQLVKKKGWGFVKGVCKTQSLATISFLRQKSKKSQKLIQHKRSKISLRLLFLATMNYNNLPELEPDDFYYNDKGFRVFTEKYHLKRGYCCKNGCIHCPFGYDKKTDAFIQFLKPQPFLTVALKLFLEIFEKSLRHYLHK